MSKEILKKKIRADQNGACALSGVNLPGETKLFDTDRKREKFKGGTYNDNANVRVVDPVAHMERHGTLKVRVGELDMLKTICDSRRQIMKSVMSAQNRLLAYQRKTDHFDEATREWLGEYLEIAKKKLDEKTRELADYVKKEVNHPMVGIARNVPGLKNGWNTIGHMLAYIDIAKASCASALWSYTGLDKASHERYKKNMAGGGNRTLRTALYCFAETQIKGQTDPTKPRYAPYREVYDRAKFQKSISRHTVKTYNTQGKQVEVMWKDAKPSHRHGHAIRVMIKHFLADWWFVHRTLEGLPTRPLYVEEKLGHTGIIRPQERGWEI